MAMTAAALRQLPARVVSEATGANIRTVERWRAGATPRRHAYRLRLDDLAALMEVLGEHMAPRARLAWLTARNAHLGWHRPVEVLARGDFDRVRGAALAYAAGDLT
jgi:hypothetical protein